jgi:glycosyltransferase involved in cell wall biosynthesis
VKPSTILFVETSSYASYGGSKRVLVHLATALDPDRFRARALFYRSGPWVADLERRGVTVEVAEDLAPGGPPEGRGAPDAMAPLRLAGVRETESGDLALAWPRRMARDARFQAQLAWRDARASRRLDRFLEAPVDLVHVNAALHTEYAWYHAARRHRLPYVIHEHGLWKTPPRAWAEVARGAAAVLCLTETRMEQVRANAGLRVRVELLPNGLPAEAFAPRAGREDVRRGLGVPPGTALLVTAGHLQAWKGQDLAVEAAGLLRDRGVPFVWLLCGSTVEPEFERALRDRIRTLDLNHRVRLLGARTDLRDLFGAADLAVHTSVLPEPFGLVVVEAMAAETPVVGPAEGSLPELVRDGVDGRLVPPRDAVALASTIAALLENVDALRRLGRNARERAAEKFRIETQVRTLEAIYARALTRDRRSPPAA